MSQGDLSRDLYEAAPPGDLCRDLERVDASLRFLVIVIASVLLSFAATLRQRRAAELLLAGDAQAAAAVGEVFPLRKGASALVIGALGFFLCLALDLAQEAEGAAARRSAGANLWASALVLAAAIVRWRDLLEVHARTAAQESQDLPEL